MPSSEVHVIPVELSRDAKRGTHVVPVELSISAGLICRIDLITKR